MLWEPIVDRQGMSVYEAVYQRLKTGIRQGDVTGRLPSKIQAAKYLQVSKVTIELVYGQLKAEGYLRSKPRSGFFVAFTASSPPPTPKKTTPEKFSPTSSSAVDLPFDLGTYSVSGDSFPFATWSRLMRKVVAREGAELLRSTPRKGIYSLRENIADYLQAYRGIHADPEQILVGAGTEWMTALLMQLLGPRRRYALENPGYRKIWSLLRAFGMTTIGVNMRQEGIDLSQLAQVSPEVVHITPSHHFPLGMAMPIAKRTALLELAEEMDFFVLEDDYDCEFRFRGRPIPALQSLDHHDRVIYINTFAKSLAPSLRVSYMVLPMPLMKTYEDNFAFHSCTVPGFEQHVLASFMNEGHFEKHLNRMKTVYKTKHDMLIKALQQSKLNDRIRFAGKDAGLHFLLRLEGNQNEKQMVRKARQAGIAMTGLSDFYHEKTKVPDNTVVIGFANVNEEQMPNLIEKLEKAWK